MVRAMTTSPNLPAPPDAAAGHQPIANKPQRVGAGVAEWG
ncbi:MAG: hypothetical protein QOF84_1750 [Streptomyces sp.]|jgi:hypothetical protein|nr:hypothetical protein [Streptomyces sp.]